jgi:pyrroline-5-carboxylate reductase
MNYKIGFIGCGNMGGALVKKVAKTLSPDAIAVCDHNKEKTDFLQCDCGVTPVNADMLAMNSDFIVLGVKPQNMQQTISAFAENLKANQDAVVITMAAGISISAIRAFIGADLPVIRIMPNTPALVGEGMILYDCAGVSKQDEEAFKALFAKAGVLDKLAEDKIDAASALSGCGPAFVYAFAEALADGAVECGVPRDKAQTYAAQTILGAGKMLLEFGHPADLKDAVCSPGGTTIAGVHALEKGGFRSASMDAVFSAYKRTLELKK